MPLALRWIGMIFVTFVFFIVLIYKDVKQKLWINAIILFLLIIIFFGISNIFDFAKESILLENVPVNKNPEMMDSHYFNIHFKYNIQLMGKFICVLVATFFYGFMLSYFLILMLIKFETYRKLINNKIPIYIGVLFMLFVIIFDWTFLITLKSEVIRMINLGISTNELNEYYTYLGTIEFMISLIEILLTTVVFQIVIYIYTRGLKNIRESISILKK